MADWDRTVLAVSRIRKKGEVYSVGGADCFKGYRIIHRDSPIDPGVYIGKNAREAIVVDTARYPGLSKLYAAAKSGASGGRRVSKGLVLDAVYDTVAEAMPLQGTEHVDSAMKAAGLDIPDILVPLDFFISAGAGVCRHDGLACAALLEMFVKEGCIAGKPSVDRNSDYLGGHAWGRYTNSALEIIILDVSLGYFGDLRDAPPGSRWAYERPEDF